MNLPDVTAALEAIAPLQFAEPWDNVGLLVEPAPPATEAASSEREVSQVLLTVDLGLDVLAEARGQDADLIVAYHPPIFAPLKRLTLEEPGQRLILQAIADQIAIYSPHTALDAAPGGVNDWLAVALGEGQTEPLEQTLELDPTAEHKLVVFVPEPQAATLRDALSTDARAGWIGNYSHCSYNLRGEGTFWGHEGAEPAVGEKGQLETVPEVRLEMVCAARDLARAAQVIRRVHPYEEPAWDVYRLGAKPRIGSGMGRRISLHAPAPITSVVERIKHHLDLQQVRVAAAERHTSGELIRTGAVCAGAGDSLLAAFRGSDLVVTGELRHHNVTALVAQGTSVVLCGHTNTERGYLPELASRLRAVTGGKLQAQVATSDRDPLQVM